MQYGQKRVYTLVKTAKVVDKSKGMALLQAEVLSIDWDGAKFGLKSEHLGNYEFEGTADITSLKYYPLEFSPEKTQVTQELVARGLLFEKLAGYHYKSYKGVALRWDDKNDRMEKISLDGRIVIDAKSFYHFNSNQGRWVSPLGKEGTEVNKYLENSNQKGEDAGEDVGQDDGEEENNECETGDCDNSEFCFVDGTDGDDTPARRRLSEAELLLTTPLVTGYSMKTKAWHWFFIRQIGDIQFAECAFDKLVLPPGQKALINAFVESQHRHEDDFDDIIEGKGKGIIMLLAGSPGVGKTLTAESVAEKLQAPLYCLSASDFGGAYEVEYELRQVLEMVTRWKGVVLIDEADVFLEARNTTDLEHNRLVSIFLRLLEYYQGTMFLTTNRVQHIDAAFHSRIHVTINYPELSAESRRQIWKTFLADNHGGVTEKEIEILAEEKLNGRQIKNAVKTSRLLARSERRDEKNRANTGLVQMKHIRMVMEIDKATAWN